MSKKKSSSKAPGVPDQIKALQGTLSGLQAPSADETGVSNQLAGITSSSALGQANVQDPTKNPVAMGFQTGQAAAISKQAEAASVPLSQRLALLQQQRQSAIDVNKTNLGFAQDAYNKKLADYEAKQQQKSTQKVGKNKNKADVQRALIAASAKKKSGGSKAAGTKLQKATKYDSNGNQISGTFNPSTGAYSWDAQTS